MEIKIDVGHPMAPADSHKQLFRTPSLKNIDDHLLHPEYQAEDSEFLSPINPLRSHPS